MNVVLNLQQNNFLELLSMALETPDGADVRASESGKTAGSGIVEAEWDGILRLAREQALAGFIARVAREYAPGDRSTTWNREHYAQVGQYYALLHEQSELHRLLDENDIRYAVLKGCAAAVYYPKSAIRTMGDIDFIVAPEDVRRTYELLIANGYVNEYGSYEKADDKNPRHIVLVKNGVTYELHRFFVSEGGLPVGKAVSVKGYEPKSGPEREFNELIYDALKAGETDAADESQSRGIERVNIGGKYEFFKLNDMVNGLVLLQHINQHIGNGLGLRQFIDWMMFVRYSGVDAGEFLALSERYGLRQLAVHASMLCKLFLEAGRDSSNVEPGRDKGDTASSNQHTSSPCISDDWCIGADEDACRVMMCKIFRDGNFGHNDVTSASIRSIMHGKRNPIAYLKRLQLGGMCRWEAAQQHAVLRPFAWLYQLGRVIPQMLRRKDAIGSIKQDMEMAEKEREMLQKLRPFVILLIAFMIFTTMPFVTLVVGESPYAEATSKDVGYLDSGDKTFIITGRITDWSVLSDLPDTVEEIYFSDEEGEGCGIYTGDLDELLTLGGSCSTIPAIIANDAAYIKPYSVLPSYDPVKNRFSAGTDVRGSNYHQLPYTFYWSGTLRYVYGNTEPTVRIIHDVTGKSGQTTVALLEYAGVAGSGVQLDGSLVVDEDCTAGNVVRYDTLNDSNSGSVSYVDAINYTYGSSEDTETLCYDYDVNIKHLSTVAVSGSADILGTITAKVTMDGKAGSSDEIGWYIDEECRTEAERYDRSTQKWVKVGSVKTDENGCCTVSNIRPGTYYVKEMSGGEVKQVVLEESRKSVKLGGGLGSETTVNADSVTLTPDMDGNGNIDWTGEPMEYKDINSAANTGTVNAADYGGQLFIATESGSHISGETDGLVELSDCSVTVGTVEKKCAGYTEAIEYVNGTLIDAQALDAEDARDHVKLSQLYADEDLNGYVEFRLTSKGDAGTVVSAVDGNSSGGGVETSDAAMTGIWIAMLIAAMASGKLLKK